MTDPPNASLATLELQLQQEVQQKSRAELVAYVMKLMSPTYRHFRRPELSGAMTMANLQQAYLDLRCQELGFPPNVKLVARKDDRPKNAAATADTNKKKFAATPTSASATASSLPSSHGPTPNSSAKRKRAAAKMTTPAKEKRLKRYRSTCSSAVQQRISRARTQRLYLVEPPKTTTTANDNDTAHAESSSTIQMEFAVMGSTGNIYTVSIGNLITCSCPDHLKGNVCKHILFIYLKVIGLSATCPLIYQSALLTTELQDIFGRLECRMAAVGRGSSSSSVMANARVQKAYSDLKSPPKKPKCHAAADDDDEDNDDGVQRKPTEGEDCPICFDALADEKLVYCKAMCGANFHASCMDTWKQQHCGRGAVTCPNCRSHWQDDSIRNRKGVASSPEGYANLGRLQGQSSDRDTSTYSEWYGRSPRGSPRRKRRSRW